MMLLLKSPTCSKPPYIDILMVSGVSLFNASPDLLFSHLTGSSLLAIDNDNTVYTYNVVVTQAAAACQSVLNPAIAVAINVYPNPSKDWIKIDGLTELSNIQIFDITGKLILSQEYQADDRIDISNLTVGMYILNIRNSEGVSSKKIIKL